MENFTLPQIILTFVIALVVGLIIPVINAVSATLKERKAAKQASLDEQVTQSVESRRLGLAEDERNQQEFTKILEFWKIRAEKCEAELKAENESGSLPTSRVYRFYRQKTLVGRELSILETKFIAGASKSELDNQLNKLRKAFDILDEI